MLEKLEKHAKIWREQKIPILNSEEAKWLWDFVEEHEPKKVLELGTAVGFSGSILGHLGAQLHTVDSDARALETAHKIFEEFEIDATVYEGDAIDMLDELILMHADQFDLIFMDHQKKQYIDVLEACYKLLQIDGILLVDDILMDKAKEFKEKIAADTRFECQLLEMGDGILICKKVE